MPRLHLGVREDGTSFSLPVELVTQTEAILGIRGSGKTNTATAEVEEALKAGVQVVVIDPTDGWWGLKSSADGESDGFPVIILGGPHGDLPLSANHGRALADFAVDQRVPLILSLRHLRKGEQRALVTDFAEQIYHRKGEPGHRIPLLVVIDEASQFVPQKVMGESARMVGAIQDLVRLGRSSGFGVVLIDQRPASVNKDVLTQLEVMVAHQITSPQDRKALREWIEQHDTGGREREFLDSLASLPRGTAWFWSPGLDVFERVRVRARQTFDSSRTPRIGEELAGPTAWAAVDLSAPSDQLSAALKEAEENDPKALRKRIAEMERDLREAVAHDRQPYPTAEAYERVCECLRVAEAQVADLTSRLVDARELAVRIAAIGTLEEPKERAPIDTPRPQAPPALRRAGSSVSHPAISATSQPAAGVTAPQQRILDSLARLEAVGATPAQRSVVAALSGYAASGGGFRNYLSAMRTAGYLEYPGSNLVELTDAGRALATADHPTTLADLHAGWMSILDGPHRRILQEIIRAYPRSISREELAGRTGYEPTGGGFRNYLSRLRSIGAIEYPTTGIVAATPLLFPEALTR